MKGSIKYGGSKLVNLKVWCCKKHISDCIEHVCHCLSVSLPCSLPLLSSYTQLFLEKVNLTWQIAATMFGNQSGEYFIDIFSTTRSADFTGKNHGNKIRGSIFKALYYWSTWILQQTNRSRWECLWACLEATWGHWYLYSSLLRNIIFCGILC